MVMTYNEIARRALEKQGVEEWLGPQALEYERKLREKYQLEKERALHDAGNRS